MIEWQENFILDNGQLNDAVIVKREPLETFTKGRSVERVYVTPANSFIFKRFTNNLQSEKEIWIQDNILPSFPDFYPKIIAKSRPANPKTNWIAFMDFGQIHHEYSYKVLYEVIKHMAWWHSLPVNMYKDIPLTGSKPKLAEIKTKIIHSKEILIETLESLKVPKKKVSRIFQQIENMSLSTELVLSHGDLHPGNFGTSENKLVILDWEYAHLNTRYWDLYHLLDLSHPLYPKKVTKELRNQILNEYYYQANTVGIEIGMENFKKEYYMFAVTFSLWMMMLIHDDLNQKEIKWLKRALKGQLIETVESFIQCSELLLKMYDLK